MSMPLKELVASMTLLEMEGPLKQIVTSLVYDPRRAMPGSLFFSLAEGPGAYADVQLALEKGAAGVVCRRGMKLRKRQTCIQVPEVRMALAEAAAAFHDYPGDKLKLIFVPGNHGHAQFAFLLKNVLEGAGVKTGLISSVRNELGERVLPASRGLPEPSDIQLWLAEALREGCSACIIEAPLESVSRERFANTSFDIVALTDLPAELPVFSRELGPVLRGSAQSRKALFAVLNWDQPEVQALPVSRCDAQVKFGWQPGADVTALAAGFDLDGTTFTLQLPGTRFPCRVPLRGRHNLSRLLGAAGVALCLDIQPTRLQESLDRLQQAPGNLEKVGDSGGAASVFVDGAQSPEELKQVLGSLHELAAGRLILALGCDYHTSGKTRYEIGKVAGGFAAHVILTSDNPGREPVEQICSAIAQGIEQSEHASYHFQPDRALAIREAVEMARPGDVVLIAGKGERAVQELCHTIIPFHDRQIAEEYLERMHTAPLAKNRLTPEPVPH